MAFQVLDEPGRPRALLPEPRQLVVGRVGIVEDPVRVPVERLDVAGFGRGKAADVDAADPVHALGVLVLPGDVVPGTRRQHVDVVAVREAFGHQPAVVLGAAEDLRAVALDDEGDFHAKGSRSLLMLSTSCARPNSRRRTRCPSMTCPRTRSSRARSPEGLRGVLQVLRAEKEPGAAERLGHRSCSIREDGHVHGHGLEQRHAEPLVLAQGDVGRRRSIIRGQVDVWHGTCEHETIRRHLVLADERADRGVVGGHRVGFSHEDEAIVEIDVPLVELPEPDMVLDLLVRGDAAHEQEVVEPVPQGLFEGRLPRGRRQPVGVDGDREHGCRGEPEGLELQAVVGRVTQGQVDMADERGQLPAPEDREAEHQRGERREEVRRRDVVVLQHAAAGKAGELHRQRGRQRIVKDRDVASARRGIADRPHVASQVFVDRGRKEVGLVPQLAQERPHLPGAVANGIAPVRGRYPLVDDHRSGPRPSAAGARPAGSAGRA